jgi:hypothetical protein
MAPRHVTSAPWSATDHGAEACNLGAMIHGAELRVHFLKSFQKGSTCENLSQKGLKIKKDGTEGWRAAEKSRKKHARKDAERE